MINYSARSRVRGTLEIYHAYVRDIDSTNNHDTTTNNNSNNITNNSNTSATDDSSWDTIDDEEVTQSRTSVSVCDYNIL